MMVENRACFFTDATVNIDCYCGRPGRNCLPGCRFARRLGLTPRVAMLSFSNFSHTQHPLSEKVRKAIIIRGRCDF